jgi:hypothetical protein
MCKKSGNHVHTMGKQQGVFCAGSSTSSYDWPTFSHEQRGKAQVLLASPTHLFAQLSTSLNRLTYLLSQGFSPQSPVPITITTKF